MAEVWAPQFVPERLDGPALTRLLPALVGADVDYLRRHPRTPLLFVARPRYRADPPGREQWLTVPFILSRGDADCKSLAAWRCAELRVRGIDARCTWSEHRMPDRTVWHVRVTMPDGHVEDPSAILGMGWEDPDFLLHLLSHSR